MNKQEVIKKIREIYAVDSSVNHVINLINQIEEPQKVVVPRFIDSFIQYAKNEDMSLYIAMDNAQNPEEEWIIENEDLFARAWLDGYEVEQEKLYTVIIPHSQNHRGQVQYLCKKGKNWFFCGNDINRFKTKFTKVQIEEAGFGWVFEQEFAKEVE